MEAAMELAAELGEYLPITARGHIVHSRKHPGVACTSILMTENPHAVSVKAMYAWAPQVFARIFRGGTLAGPPKSRFRACTSYKG